MATHPKKTREMSTPQFPRAAACSQRNKCGRVKCPACAAGRGQLQLCVHGQWRIMSYEEYLNFVKEYAGYQNQSFLEKKDIKSGVPVVVVGTTKPGISRRLYIRPRTACLCLNLLLLH